MTALLKPRWASHKVTAWLPRPKLKAQPPAVKHKHSRVRREIMRTRGKNCIIRQAGTSNFAFMRDVLAGLKRARMGGLFLMMRVRKKRCRLPAAHAWQIGHSRSRLTSSSECVQV